MTDTFRVLITGSRDWPSQDAVWERLAMLCAEELPNGGTLTLVHGDCPTGADYYARWWCSLPDEPGYDLTVIEERHPADWDRFGKSAGPRRNGEMVALGADLVLAFPLPGPRQLSRGTWNCIDAARRAGLKVEVVPDVDMPRAAPADVEEMRRADPGVTWYHCDACDGAGEAEGCESCDSMGGFFRNPYCNKPGWDVVNPAPPKGAQS